MIIYLYIYPSPCGLMVQLLAYVSIFRAYSTTLILSLTVYIDCIVLYLSQKKNFFNNLSFCVKMPKGQDKQVSISTKINMP